MDTIAARLFKADDARAELEGLLHGIPYERLGWDEYDNSLELYKVHDDYRMAIDTQRLIFDVGFSTAYVNHRDGWETHYSWRGSTFKPARGWRRRWVQDRDATTTRSVGVGVTSENAGYYEISYWPESWRNHGHWKETGYMRIVPDPLELTLP